MACSVDSGLTERPWVQLQLTFIYDSILFTLKVQLLGVGAQLNDPKGKVSVPDTKEALTPTLKTTFNSRFLILGPILLRFFSVC